MPEISRFFGIVVQMCYADHDPPHFHVRYAGQRALTEWAALHQKDFDGRLGSGPGRGLAKADCTSGVKPNVERCRFCQSAGWLQAPLTV